MKASALGPLALLAFMATLEHSSALPATDLVRRVPVANPGLPTPSIGHGPVSLPSALPTPIQPRDGTLQLPQAGTIELPNTAGGSQGPDVQRRGAPICPLGTSQGPDGTCHGGTSPGPPIERREVPICPLGTAESPDGTCHGGTSPGPPIERREVPICPLTNPQCHGGTSPVAPIRRRSSTAQSPQAGTGQSPDDIAQFPNKRRGNTGQGPDALGWSQTPQASTVAPPA
jgi:hypothetical protein